MQAFLDRCATALAGDAHTARVLDRADRHGARALVVAPNVTLVSLPPYAPELSPVVRVGLCLRERLLVYRLLDNHGANVEACCEARDTLTPERLRSLCAQPLGSEGRFIGPAVQTHAAFTRLYVSSDRHGPAQSRVRRRARDSRSPGVGPHPTEWEVWPTVMRRSSTMSGGRSIRSGVAGPGADWKRWRL